MSEIREKVLINKILSRPNTNRDYFCQINNCLSNWKVERWFLALIDFFSIKRKTFIGSLFLLIDKASKIFWSRLFV